MIFIHFPNLQQTPNVFQTFPGYPIALSGSESVNVTSDRFWVNGVHGGSLQLGAWVSDTNATSKTWEKKPLVPPSNKKMEGNRKTEHLRFPQKNKEVFLPEKIHLKTEKMLQKKTSDKITAKIRKFNFCPKRVCLKHMFCFITHDMSEIGVNRQPPPCKWWLPLFWSSWCSCPSSSKVPFAIRFAPWVHFLQVSHQYDDVAKTWSTKNMRC